MQHLGYTSCPANPDLWYKEVTQPVTGELYYSYILINVDDISCIHHDAMPVLDKLNQYYTLKPSSIGNPSMYLGTKLKLMQMSNQVWVWGMSPLKYINETASYCKKYLNSNYDSWYVLPTQAANPLPWDFSLNYETPALDSDQAPYFQSIISVMQWMCKIRCITIATEVSVLSLHLAYPQEGHLDAGLHVMGYLWLKYNSRLIFDPTYPHIDDSTF
jgi:hypothetical protein